MNLWSFYQWSGVEIIPDPYLPVNQGVQVKKHRKKRINKKWAKRYGYHPTVYFAGNSVFAHPDVIALMSSVPSGVK